MKRMSFLLASLALLGFVSRPPPSPIPAAP